VEICYKRIIDLIGHVYEAAITPTHWPTVLEQLADITRSKSAALAIHDLEVKQISYVHMYGLSKPVSAFLNSPMGKLDPSFRVMQRQRAGKAVNMWRLDDPDTVPSVFQAFVSRLSDLFYFGGINFFNDASWHAGIGLHRTKEAGEFEPEILQLLEDLVPHFQRALRIQREFTRLRLQQQMVQQELDRHILGLMLLSGSNELLYMNPMAEQIIERHGAIDLRDNAVHAFAREANEQLQRAIREAATAPPKTVNAGQALGLTHPDHSMPLAVLVVPSGPGQLAPQFPEEHSRVAVYITDLEASAPIADDALMETYGLTEREAGVAVAVANGCELSQVAEMEGVSVETVRSQLKSVFRKTGVNRQVDLVRLLLAGPFLHER